MKRERIRGGRDGEGREGVSLVEGSRYCRGGREGGKEGRSGGEEAGLWRGKG